MTRSAFRANAAQYFEKWIDWQNSPRKRFYEKLLRPRLYQDVSKPDMFELPASAVTKKLIHAIESPRPRPRYHVTWPTHIAGVSKRLLSTRLLDRFTRRF